MFVPVGGIPYEPVDHLYRCTHPNWSLVQVWVGVPWRFSWCLRYGFSHESDCRWIGDDGMLKILSYWVPSCTHRRYTCHCSLMLYFACITEASTASANSISNIWGTVHRQDQVQGVWSGWAYNCQESVEGLLRQGDFWYLKWFCRDLSEVLWLTMIDSWCT